jgi:hypothetical protein
MEKAEPESQQLLHLYSDNLYHFVNHLFFPSQSEFTELRCSYAC